MKEKSANANIIMVGMPASGKSTVGVIVAKVLGKDFLDSDIVIQQRENAKLSEIIKDRGVDYFLKCEEEALLSIDATNTVIATGGSAIYSEAGITHLKNDAIIVYLKVGLEDLKKRLTDIKGRGVVLKDGESLEQMYETRSVLYERYADVTVEENKNTLEDTVRQVVEMLG